MLGELKDTSPAVLLVAKWDPVCLQAFLKDSVCHPVFHRPPGEHLGLCVGGFFFSISLIFLLMSRGAAACWDLFVI